MCQQDQAEHSDMNSTHNPAQDCISEEGTDEQDIRPLSDREIQSEGPDDNFSCLECLNYMQQLIQSEKLIEALRNENAQLQNTVLNLQSKLHQKSIECQIATQELDQFFINYHNYINSINPSHHIYHHNINNINNIIYPPPQQQQHTTPFPTHPHPQPQAQAQSTYPQQNPHNISTFIPSFTPTVPTVPTVQNAPNIPTAPTTPSTTASTTTYPYHIVTRNQNDYESLSDHHYKVTNVDSHATYNNDSNKPSVRPFKKALISTAEKYDSAKTIIFISSEHTNNAIRNNLICEPFEDSRQIFHFLNWTIKLQRIDMHYKSYQIKCMNNPNNKNNKNNTQQNNHTNHAIRPAPNTSTNTMTRSMDEEIIIFNPELHSTSRFNENLYLVGVRNDAELERAAKWKMYCFMDANELYDKYGIYGTDLPSGCRSMNAALYERNTLIIGYIRSMMNMCHNNDDMYVDNIISLCMGYYNHAQCRKELIYNNTTMNEYSKLKIIKTKFTKDKHVNSPYQFNIDVYDLYQCIMKTLNNNSDCKYETLSIISFDKQKTNYFVDTLLPVLLDDNNWVGIVYRDNKPISVCIDWYDIANKIKLYNPWFNINQNEWYHNDITKLIISPQRKQNLRISNNRFANIFDDANINNINSMNHMNHMNNNNNNNMNMNMNYYNRYHNVNANANANVNVNQQHQHQHEHQHSQYHRQNQHQRQYQHQHQR